MAVYWFDEHFTFICLINELYFIKFVDKTSQIYIRPEIKQRTEIQVRPSFRVWTLFSRFSDFLYYFVHVLNRFVCEKVIILTALAKSSLCFIVSDLVYSDHKVSEQEKMQFETKTYFWWIWKCLVFLCCEK